MKRILALLAALGLLAGCAHGTDDEEPVWQTELAEGGTLSISGCTVSEETVQLRYFADLDPLPRPILHMAGKHAPTLTLTGTEKDTVTFLFVEHADDGTWVIYRLRTPEEKLDYVFTQREDGSLQYRMDTVCSYAIAIGPELWILDITREGL